MLVATTEKLAGYTTKQSLGQVFGLVVRSRGLGGNLMAGLRSLVGGEIHEYTQLLEETRRQALDRMVRNATAMGANAVVMMRFDSSEIGQTMSEIVAYGTAVILEPESLRVGARCGLWDRCCLGHLRKPPEAHTSIMTGARDGNRT